MGSVWAGAAGVPDAGGGAGGSSTSISLMTTGIGWPPSVSAQAGAELRAGIEGQDSARRQQPRVVDVVRRGDGLPRDRAAGTGDDALDRVAVLAQRQRCRTDTGGCAGTERGGCADTRVRAEALARAGPARTGPRVRPCYLHDGQTHRRAQRYSGVGEEVDRLGHRLDAAEEEKRAPLEAHDRPRRTLPRVLGQG